MTKPGWIGLFIVKMCIVLEEVLIMTGFTYPVVLLYLQEFLDRRKMTEFGSLALVDEGAGDGDGVSVSLPGVRRGTTLTRRLRPVISVEVVCLLQGAVVRSGYRCDRTETA